MSDAFCGGCGRAWASGDAFCPGCGRARADGAGASPATATSPLGIPAQPPHVEAPPDDRDHGAGNGCSVGAIVCSLVACFAFPVLVGGAALVLAALASSRREGLSVVAVVAAVLGLLTGLGLGWIAPGLGFRL